MTNFIKLFFGQTSYLHLGCRRNGYRPNDPDPFNWNVTLGHLKTNSIGIESGSGILMGFILNHKQFNMLFIRPILQTGQQECRAKRLIG